MAFIPSPSVVRVAVNLSQGILEWSNIFHVETSTNPPESTVAFLAEAVYTAYRDSFLPLLHVATNIDSATGYSLASTTAPTATYVPAQVPSGDVAGEALPLQSGGIVTWRTTARGRSGRGRTYISGWSEVSSAGSALLPGAADALGTAATAFRAALAAQLVPLVILSQYSGGNPRPVGLAFAVTSNEVRTAVYGSQRRRNRRETFAN